jgi:peroxiredoxin
MRGSVIVATGWLLLLGAPATLWASTGQERAEAAGASLIGTPAPAVKLTTIDGQTIDLARLYGHKAVYLKFWATWCVPCREQMPHFEHAFEQEGSDLTIIAINAGFNDSVEDIRTYRQKLGLKMPIVLDDGTLGGALNLRVTPQHVVIGRDGKILYIGHFVDEKLEAALKAARAEPAHAVPTSMTSMPARSAASATAPGVMVHDLSIRTIGGESLPLRDPAGSRSTVVMFLSPWCESYLAESRPARAAQCRSAREQSEALAKTSNARWIGISSGLWSTSDELIKYRDEQHIAIPLSIDESGATFREFAVKEVPTFLVIDSKGRVSRRIDKVADDLGNQLGLAIR